MVFFGKLIDIFKEGFIVRMVVVILNYEFISLGLIYISFLFFDGWKLFDFGNKVGFFFNFVVIERFDFKLIFGIKKDVFLWVIDYECLYVIEMFNVGIFLVVVSS